MKTKLIILVAALWGLSSNVASGEDSSIQGGMGTKFSSDYDRRGQLVSQEAIQAQVDLSVDLAGVDVFGKFFTNQSSDSSGSDNIELNIGVGKSLFEDNINAYLGVYNTDNSSSGDTVETFLSIEANTALSPKVTAYRDNDSELYTFEGQLSQELDLEFFAIELAGILGNTELTSATDSTYYSAALTASKQLNDNVSLYADIALSDSDLRSQGRIWGIGLDVRF